MFDSLENYVSTYKHHYKAKPPGSFATRAEKIYQKDEPLISQHLRTALQVQGKRVRSKVWPKTLVGVEEYKDFVRRLDCCKKELYKLYFASPPIDFCTIDKMLRELEKSTYQNSYSPNEYWPRKESRRYLKTAHERTNMKYYETTYGTYYNRIKEMEQYQDLLRTLVRRDQQEQLRNELRKIFKLGVTMYHTGYCIPAIEAAKKKSLRDSPLDRYTLRRI